MPPHDRPLPAVIVLLTLAVLGGGCQGANMDEEILFACESNGSCSKPDHVCDLDGLCHPRGLRLRQSRFSLFDLEGQGSSSSSGGGSSSPAAHTEPQRKPVSGNALCTKKCAERQADCTASCEEGTKCRQSCGRSTDSCYAQCRRTAETRETARQLRDEKNCMGADGRPRRCSAAEEQRLRIAMTQASTLVCLDERAEQVLCPEHLQKIEASRRFLPKNCHETGCDGNEPE